MSFTFRRGIRENVGLWVNMIGGTGAGKTFSGFRLATGMSGGKPFAVIDTENRRALHYADQFRFDHAELRAPFRPDAYAEAIAAADAAHYPVIMIDSGSHVWAGDGGVLDWHEEILDERVARALKRRGEDRPDYVLRDAYNMSAWIDPKMSHKKMVNKMLQAKAHIILCLRAEPKVEMAKDKDGKLTVVAKQSLTGLDGWIPVCEKNLPFEATASFLFMAGAPGIPHPIKLQAQHRALFPLDKPITEDSGLGLAAWASGAPKAEPPPPSPPRDSGSPPAQDGGSAPDDANIVTDIEAFVKRKKFDIAYDLCRGLKDEALKESTKTRIDRAKSYVEKQSTTT